MWRGPASAESTVTVTDLQLCTVDCTLVPAKAPAKHESKSNMDGPKTEMDPAGDAPHLDTAEIAVAASPKLPPRLPRYLLQTTSSRSPAAMERRARGEALQMEAALQRRDARLRILALKRQNKMKGAAVRRETRQIGAALEQSTNAYKELARLYVSELRELPVNIKQANESRAEVKRQCANELRINKSTDWLSRRTQAKEAKAQAARQTRDQVRRSTIRTSIPLELEEQLRRYKIGPFANAASTSAGEALGSVHAGKELLDVCDFQAGRREDCITVHPDCAPGHVADGRAPERVVLGECLEA